MSITPPEMITSDRFWESLSETQNVEALDNDKIKELAQVANVYGQSMESNIQSALAHLHTSISWTQVTLFGVLAVVFSKDLLGEGMLQGAAVGIIWMAITNFAVRSGKNYINIIRFNLLRARSLEFSVGILTFPRQSKTLFVGWTRAVHQYYVNWYCPLARWTVTRKVLFEFGFGTAYGVVLFLSVRLLRMTAMTDYPRVVLAGFGMVAAIVEACHFFWLSPYLKTIHEDARLKRQA